MVTKADMVEFYRAATRWQVGRATLDGLRFADDLQDSLSAGAGILHDTGKLAHLADTMPDGWQRWLDWHRAIAPHNRQEIQTLETDGGIYLGYVRMVGRRRRDVRLVDPSVSLPVEYVKQPLFSKPT